MDPILSDLEKDDLAWATEEEDWLNIEELDLAFLLSLECFDPSKPIDKQEEEKLGDFWDNYDTEPNGKASESKMELLGKRIQESPKTKVVVEKGTYYTEKVIASAHLLYTRLSGLTEWAGKGLFRLSGEIQES